MPDSTPGLEAAISLAALYHAGQVDKAGQPYILHPLRVMLKLDWASARIAAVLHDTVEDTNLSLDQIRGAFGETIAGAIDALTRREGEGYEDFIERCGANQIARAVKWADLCDNMDLSRLPEVTAADRERNEKYRKARDKLNAIAAAGFAQDAQRLDPEGAAERPVKQGIARPK